MTLLVDLIRKETEQILKKEYIQEVYNKIYTNLQYYDYNALNKLDDYIASQVSQLNKISTTFTSNGVTGGNGDSNDLIEYNSEIITFDNSDAHKTKQKKRISSDLIALLIISTISTIVTLIFLKMAIDDTIGSENIKPILEKVLRLDSSALVDIIEKGTIKQFNVATRDIAFYKNLVKSGDIMHGLYNIFQSTDMNQQMSAVNVNVQKITYALSWFKYSCATSMTLIGKLAYDQRDDVLNYIRNMGTIKPKVLTDRTVNTSIKLLEGDKSSGGNKTKKNKTKKNKTKKNKTKENKTKKSKTKKSKTKKN